MSDETPTPRPPPPPAQRPLPSSGTTNPPLPGNPAASGATVPPGSTPPLPRPPGPPIDFAMKAPKPVVITPALVKNLGCLIKMIVGFTILLLAGYFALIALNPKARQWATSKKGPTPFKTMNQILAIPAQAIGKTNDVVAASNANVHVLDKVIAEEDGKTAKGKSGGFAGPVADPFAAATAAANAANKPDAKSGAAGASGASDSNGVSAEALLAMQDKLAGLPDGPVTETPKDPAKTIAEAANPYSFAAKPAEEAANAQPAPPPEVKLPGGIVITSASPEGKPAATPQFIYWIVGLNISGVFQNNPHRILLNGRLVYEGQEVNQSLGIVFDHLADDQKLIVFRDKTGALVTRSY